MKAKQLGPTVMFFGKAIVIFTENANGDIYDVHAGSVQDILNDWNGDCGYVPTNDARVFFAVANGRPVNPYEYNQDFESLLRYLQEQLPLQNLVPFGLGTTHYGANTVIVTENADGDIYAISAQYIHDILDDWNGCCDFVPANDAKVYFAAWNGEPISPYEYHDFESLIMYLKEKLA